MVWSWDSHWECFHTINSCWLLWISHWVSSFDFGEVLKAWLSIDWSYFRDFSSLFCLERGFFVMFIGVLTSPALLGPNCALESRYHCIILRQITFYSQLAYGNLKWNFPLFSWCWAFLWDSLLFVALIILCQLALSLHSICSFLKPKRGDRLRQRLPVTEVKPKLRFLGELGSTALFLESIEFFQRFDIFPLDIYNLEREYALSTYQSQRFYAAHQPARPNTAALSCSQPQNYPSNSPTAPLQSSASFPSRNSSPLYSCRDRSSSSFSLHYRSPLWYSSSLQFAFRADTGCSPAVSIVLSSGFRFVRCPPWFGLGCMPRRRRRQLVVIWCLLGRVMATHL